METTYPRWCHTI